MHVVALVAALDADLPVAIQVGVAGRPPEVDDRLVRAVAQPDGSLLVQPDEARLLPPAQLVVAASQVDVERIDEVAGERDRCLAVAGHLDGVLVIVLLDEDVVSGVVAENVQVGAGRRVDRVNLAGGAPAIFECLDAEADLASAGSRRGSKMFRQVREPVTKVTRHGKLLDCLITTRASHAPRTPLTSTCGKIRIIRLKRISFRGDRGF